MTIAVPPVWRRIADTIATLGWSVPLAFALSALSGSGHRWPDLLAQFVVPVTVAATAYALMTMVLRLRMASWAALPVLLALAAACAPQASAPHPKERAPTIRLYSANVHVFNADVGAVRRSIDASGADIVVLVEFGSGLQRHMDSLLSAYPHRRISGHTDNGARGVQTIIASRWPLAARPLPDLRYQGEAALATTPIGPVGIVGVHLTRPWPYQYQWGQLNQIRAMAEDLGDTREPMVIAGDFNSVSSGRVGRQLQRELEVHPARGLAGTWPSALPVWLGVTIDQVWASPDLVFVSRRIGLDNGSDHRPVITEIRRAVP